MFTPVELQEITFRSAFLGYDKNEVKDFLNNITADYEKMYKENISLKDKNALLTDAIKEYKSMEAALRDTVVSAHSISDDIKKNAYKEAENIIIDAKNKSEEIRRETEKNLDDTNAKIAVLNQQMSIFKSKMRALIQAQAEIMEDETDSMGIQ